MHPRPHDVPHGGGGGAMHGRLPEVQSKGNGQGEEEQREGTGGGGRQPGRGEDLELLKKHNSISPNSLIKT